jgi:hypothetical protein
MTEENLAAHRANESMSQGAVTPEGEARVAAANLPHGFYSQAQNGALAALGEGAQKCADLMLFRVETGTVPKEMLKMKEPPGMCMKTKDGMTKRPANYMAFSTKMHESRAS